MLFVEGKPNYFMGNKFTTRKSYVIDINTNKDILDSFNIFNFEATDSPEITISPVTIYARELILFCETKEGSIHSNILSESQMDMLFGQLVIMKTLSLSETKTYNQIKDIIFKPINDSDNGFLLEGKVIEENTSYFFESDTNIINEFSKHSEKNINIIKQFKVDTLEIKIGNHINTNTLVMADMYFYSKGEIITNAQVKLFIENPEGNLDDFINKKTIESIIEDSYSLNSILDMEEPNQYLIDRFTERISDTMDYFKSEDYLNIPYGQMLSPRMTHIYLKELKLKKN